MKQAKSSNGYLHVSLSLDGVIKTYNIHRLVGIAFIENPDNKPEINHLDGNKTNNCVWNLEWSTRIENDLHAIINNLKKSRKGEEIGNNKFTTKDIIKVCELLIENQKSIQEISIETGVTYDMVRHILNGKSWKHITDNYDFSNYNYGKENNYKEKRKKLIHTICKMIEENKYTLKEISLINNVSMSLVSQIYHGKRHKDISCNYNFEKFKTYKS